MHIKAGMAVIVKQQICPVWQQQYQDFWKIWSCRNRPDFWRFWPWLLQSRVWSSKKHRYDQHSDHIKSNHRPFSFCPFLSRFRPQQSRPSFPYRTFAFDPFHPFLHYRSSFSPSRQPGQEKAWTNWMKVRSWDPWYRSDCRCRPDFEVPDGEVQ